EACLGEYLAFLEGDDYWTSPHKLKKQIEVLDASKSKVGCFHLVQVVDRDGQPATTEATRPEYHRELTTIDLMECDPIPTCSVVLRRSALPNLAPEFDSLVMRDWPMWIFASLKGPFAFIPDRMGAYRCHPTSIWTSKDYAYRLLAQIRLFDLLCVTLPSPYREVAVARLAKLKNHYALIQVEEGNRSEALQQANEAIGLLPHLLLSPGLSIFIKQQLAIRSPRLHGALVNAKDLCRKLLVKSGLRRAGLLP
ncbi:MAG TPA: hypothetical protein VEZ90_20075, partial [Blastocatellia bacterium]|nr:hypothetical protein [Blastocatellia bacterium]